MPHSSASDAVYLPFGSLTGVIPTDSVQRDVNAAGPGQRASQIQRQLHSLIDPRPASTKGNQIQWK